QMKSHLAALPSGDFVAVWWDGSGADGSSTAIRAQKFALDGHKWGDELVVNTTTAGAQIDPVITVLANGDFAVAWQDIGATGGDTSSNAIRAQIFRVGDIPDIVSNGGGATAAIALDENKIPVTTVAAADTDSTAFTYSIAGGADAARFHIDATTGALSFIS